MRHLELFQTHLEALLLECPDPAQRRRIASQKTRQALLQDLENLTNTLEFVVMPCMRELTLAQLEETRSSLELYPA